MKTVRLSEVAQGRDNNFNLIRAIAALAVLVTHSYALATGNTAIEPLRDTLGVTLGSIAVDVFFITSGFLVTASLMVRQSTLDFVLARALRILPALVVMLLLTVFLLGPLLTTWQVSDYLTSQTVYIYLAKCSTLILGVRYDLPGVFADNPYRNAVNGSLWTMPHEVRMYAILAVAWFALRLARHNRLFFLRSLVIGFALVSGIVLAYQQATGGTTNKVLHLFFMFFTGSAFYILRDRIRLHLFAFALLLALVVLATRDKALFQFVYTYSVAYLLFYAAYIPRGAIRRFNNLGDYSYGLYIYAFPVQQTVAASTPGISILDMTLVSVAVTLLLAMLSWHLLEQRALGLKGHYVARLRQAMRPA